MGEERRLVEGRSPAAPRAGDLDPSRSEVVFERRNGDTDRDRFFALSRSEVELFGLVFEAPWLSPLSVRCAPKGHRLLDPLVVGEPLRTGEEEREAREIGELHTDSERARAAAVTASSPPSSVIFSMRAFAFRSWVRCLSSESFTATSSIPGRSTCSWAQQALMMLSSFIGASLARCFRLGRKPRMARLAASRARWATNGISPAMMKNITMAEL
mmetsp:Transcript_11367/g.27304  ORF Transcript_11367/g.27304 Transcript_11367/m.27304 type:complete len:214 (+) Transcript_11367:307-948(+)